MEKFQIWTPLGWLQLCFAQRRFMALSLQGQAVSQALPMYARHVVDQLYRYFDNPAHRFQIDFVAQGTVFQQSVWRLLPQIETGETRTYGQLAAQLGSAPRAVGQALKRNPYPLFIPCHRVVSKVGIGGFAGATGGHLLQTKRWLLSHERAAPT